MRIRATHLQVAQYCTGSPEMQRRTDQRPLVDDAVRLGTIGHAYLEIALSVGWGAAAAWLAGVPDVEAALPELLDPEVQPWIEQEVLEGRSVEVETPATLPVGPMGDVVSMRLDAQGEGLVVDWKFGRGQRWFLPHVTEDLQMLAYGCWMHEQAGYETVYVKRVRVGDRCDDLLVLDVEAYHLAREWLHAIVGDVVEHSERRTPGLWCSHCWARHACPERLDLVAPVTTALALPDVQLSLSPVQASDWALAREALRDRMDALDSALRCYVEAGGEVRDRDQGRRMVVNRYRKDRLVASGPDLLAELALAAGGHGAGALGSTKGKVMDAMKAAGLDRAARDAVWERWREAGLVEGEDVATLRWVKDRKVIGA